MSLLEFKTGYVYEVHCRAYPVRGNVTVLRVKGTVLYDSPKEVVFPHGVVIAKSEIVSVVNPPELVEEARREAAIDPHR